MVRYLPLPVGRPRLSRVVVSVTWVWERPPSLYPTAVRHDDVALDHAHRGLVDRLRVHVHVVLRLLVLLPPPLVSVHRRAVARVVRRPPRETVRQGRVVPVVGVRIPVPGSPPFVLHVRVVPGRAHYPLAQYVPVHRQVALPVVRRLSPPLPPVLLRVALV